LFTATVNSRPGTSFWVICLYHHAMQLRVKVASNAAEATPQETIDEVRDAQIAQDTELARATHAKYGVKRSSHRTQSGRRVWDAWAGVDTGHVALYAFYPRKLVVREGDGVRWHFDHLVFEDHTASIPVPGVFGIDFDRPWCDPDGDGGAGPDTPAEEHENAPPSCPEGSELEIDIEDQLWGGVGNGVLAGRRDVEHSGIRGHQAADVSPPAAGDGPFDVRFRNSTGKKGIDYLCFIHGNMEGNVVVR
jgi:plastocyanin